MTLNAALDWREAKDMQPVIEEAQCHDAAFRVWEARVFGESRRLPVEFGRHLEWQIPLADIPFVLGRIEFDLMI